MLEGPTTLETLEERTENRTGDPVALETLSNELRSMKNFTELFEVDQEKVKPEFRTTLAEAPAEIADIVTEPLLNERERLERLKNPYTREYEEGVRALEFFEDFCSDLCEVERYRVESDADAFGGIRISLFPQSYWAWAVIGGDDIAEVEIVVRTGDEGRIDDSVYTPLQLNFRFLDNTRHEVDSWRLDMHNKGARKIQVDARVGADRISVHHKDIESINRSRNPQASFRALQSAFLVNFAERFLLERNSDNYLMALPDATFGSQKEFDLIADAYTEAESFLSGKN